MANVKFYRLGLNNGVSQGFYDQYKTQDASQAIIFANVKQGEGKPLAQYIWANGIEYHVADASILNQVEQTLTVLLDGMPTPIDTSIGKMIEDAINEHGLSAEKFVELVSNDSNVKAEVVDGSVRLTAPDFHASIDVSTVVPETYFIGKNPKHGDYYVKEEVITEKVGAEPRRTAYIYNSDEDIWQVLDGNVDATNVFFHDGVNRTAAIGVLPATSGGAIENEGKAMNLKELLEYYLVEELYKGTAHNATFSTPTWSIVGGNNATPKDLKTYVKINGATMSGTTALVKVGSTVSVNAIEVTAVPAYSGSITHRDGTAAYVDDMFKYSNDGETIIDESSKTGTQPSADFTDSNNFDSATATVSLVVSNGFSVITTSTQSGNINDTITIAAQSEAIPEGTHTMTLSYSNNLSASRIINSSVAATTVSVYPVSNKDNVSTGQLTANGLIPSDNHKNATNNVTKGNTSITIKAVYPIFTNGIKNADQTNGLNDYDTNFKWSDSDTYHGQESTSANYTEWDIFDAVRTIYINVNDFTLGNIDNKPIVFIPSSLGLKINTGDANRIPAAATDGTGKITGYSSGSLYFETSEQITLDGVNYDMYKMAGSSGPTSLKIQIVKK